MRVKNLISFFLLSNLLLINIFSQINWQQTNGPQGISINSFVVDPNGKIIVHGNGSGLWEYDSVNNLWYDKNNGFNGQRYFNYIGTADNGDLYVADGNQIWKSTDNGDYWFSIGSGFEDLRWLGVSKSPLIFAATRNGGIFKSTNGGGSWEEANSGLTTTNIISIEVGENDVVIASSDDGKVFISTDNGSIWNLSSTFQGGGINVGIDSQNHVFFTYGNQMYRSLDLGESWTQIYNQGDNRFYIDLDDNIYKADWNGYVSISRDGGDTWERKRITLTNSSVQPVAGNNGIMLAFIYDKGLYISEDYGNNWFNVDSYPICTRITDISITSSNRVFAGVDQNNSGLFFSDDNGENWTAINNNLLRNVYAVHVTPEDIIFASGNDTKVLKSTDNGLSWFGSANGINNNYHIYEFIDNRRGKLVARSSYGIYTSENNGSNWTEIYFSQNYYLGGWNEARLFSMQNGDVIVHLRDENKVYRIENITNNIVEITNLPGNNIYDFMILPNDRIIINTNQGAYQSTNNAASWSVYNVNNFPGYVYDYCINKGGEFIAVNWSSIYKTKDNGNTWEYENYPVGTSNYGLTALQINNEGILFLGTEGRGVFKKQDDYLPHFQLSQPGDHETIFNNDAYLSWSTNYYYSSFTLEVSSDSLFDNILYYIDDISDTNYSLPNLSLDSEYFWRVSLISPFVDTLVSASWNFKTKLNKTVLVSPNSDLLNVEVNPVFKWIKVVLADKYQLQISSDSQFVSNDFIFNDLIDTSYQLVDNLQYDTKYFWRVKSLTNEGNESEFSDANYFTTLMQPINLSTPGNNFQNSSLEQNLSWLPNPNVDYYHLQLAKDNIFGEIIAEDSLLTENTYPINNLDENETYYWRVRSKRGEKLGEYSEVWSFKTQDIPNLLSPVNGAIGRDLSLTLDWETFSNSTYNLQISTLEDFSIIELEVTNLIESTYDLTGLQPLMKYYWRIKAVSNELDGDYSKAFSFKTKGSPLETVLLEPTNNSKNIDFEEITFKWESSKASTRVIRSEVISRSRLRDGNTGDYWFEITTDKVSLSDLVIDSTLVDTLKTITDLSPYSEYFWRVKGRNDIGWGAYSDWYSFKTTLSAPELVYPLNSMVNAPLNINLVWDLVPNATKYHLQVSDNTSFVSLLEEDSLLTSANYTLIGLTKSKSYFWRVRAGNSDGYGKYTSYYGFSTTNDSTITSNGWQQTNGPKGLQVQSTLINPNGDIFFGGNSSGIWQYDNINDQWYSKNNGLNSSYFNYLGSSDNGELYAAEWSQIWKSTDNGGYWYQIGSGFEDIRWLGVSRSPLIFVATRNGGIYKSTNGGGSWQASNNGLTTLNIVSVELGENDVVIAGSEDGRIFISTDNGANWSLSTTYQNYIYVGISSENKLYASSNNQLYRSTDLGVTWTEIYNQGNQRFVIDKEDNIYKSDYQGYVSISKDGGDTWERNRVALTNESTQQLSANNGEVVVNFNNAGLYISEDYGSTWSEVGSYPIATIITDMGVTSNNRIFASMESNSSGLQYTDDSGDNWEAVNNNLLSYVYAIHITDDDVIFASSNSTKILKSTDNGESWFGSGNGINNNDQIYEITDNVNGKLFARGNRGLYTSIDVGANWTEVYYDENTYLGGWNENYLWPMQNGDVLILIRDNSNNDHKLYRVEKATNNLVEIINVPGSIKYSLIVMPNDRILVNTNQGTYQSTNNGASWTSYSVNNFPGNVSDYIVNAGGEFIVIDYNNISTTSDNGDSWQRESNPIGNNNIGLSSIVLSRDGIMYLGSQGRGVYKKQSDFIPYPTIVSPYENEVVYDKVVKVKWNTISSAVLYRIQLSEVSDFTTLIKDTTIASGLECDLNELKLKTTYYVRMNTITNQGVSDWSEGIEFRTEVPTAVLVNPLNESINMSVPTEFKWNSNILADSYQLQISTSITFDGSNIFRDYEGINDTTKLVDSLENDKDYYWRVRINHNQAGYGEFSSIGKFRTIMKSPLLVSPIDSAINISLSPLVKWEGVPNAEAYHLIVGTDSLLSQGIVYEDSNKVETESIVGSLESETKYYWKVKARKGEYISNFSEIWNFNTGIAPNLISPANNQLAVSINPIFNWEIVDNSITYHIQISEEKTFNEITYQDSTININTLTITGLQPLKEYYWRVRAQLLEGYTYYSSVWKFKTFGLPTLVNLLYPENEAFDIPTSLTFRWSEAKDSQKKVTTGSGSEKIKIKNILDEELLYAQTKIMKLKMNSFETKETVQKFKTNKNFNKLSKGDEDKISAIGKYWFQIVSDTSSMANFLEDSTLIDTAVIVENLSYIQKYYWRVSSKNEVGWSTFSNWNNFTTIPGPPLPPILSTPVNGATNIATNENLQLKWNSSEYADKYRLLVSNDPLFLSTVYDDTTENLTYNVSGLDASTKYRWKVSAINESGESDFSTVWTFHTLIPKPNIVTISAANNVINFAWNISNTINISRFIIYRSLTNSNFAKYDSVLSNISNFQDTDVDNGVNYFYRITAKSIYGAESELSNTVTSMPFNLPPIITQLVDQNYSSIGKNSTKEISLSINDSFDPDGTIDSVYWYINDEIVSRDNQFTISLNQGTHKIKLVIEDNDGKSDSSSSTVNLSAFAEKFSKPIIAGPSLIGNKTLFAIVSGDAVYKMNDELNINFGISVDGDVLSSTSIAYDTTIFVGSTDKNLYAFSRTGTSIWPPVPLGGELVITPTFDSLDNMLYLGVSNRNFVAVDKNSGQIRWSFFADSPIKSSAVITWDRKLVVASERGTVYGFALNNISGNSPSPSWTITSSDSIIGSPAVDADGYFFWGTKNGFIKKISMQSGLQGTVLWSTELDGGIISSPVIDGIGNLYIGTKNGKFYSINHQTGIINWMFQTDGEIHSTASISNRNNIYFGNHNGSVYSLDSLGNIRWKYQSNSSISKSIIHHNDMTYFGDYSGNLIAIYDYDENQLISKANSINTYPIWATFQGNNRRTGSQFDIFTSLGKEFLEIPDEFILYQNYPNPFNPTTIIKFGLKVDSKVKVKIYNILGQEISTIVNSTLNAGFQEVEFRASHLSSGVYLYRIEASGLDGSNFVDVKKMVILK
jgi:photosystem II stability/assembly factor-like uncharacterized protein